jgi:hypothetical protein
MSKVIVQEPTFDVWSGAPEKSGKYLETVGGLGKAQQRVKALAAQNPGKYFIFSVWNSCVLDQIDTQDDRLAPLAMAGGTR